MGRGLEPRRRRRRGRPALPPASGAGQAVRQARERADLTQAELGAPRYSRGYVSDVERGRIHPSREALEHLAARLGVPPHELGLGPPPALAPVDALSAALDLIRGARRRARTARELQLLDAAARPLVEARDALLGA